MPQTLVTKADASVAPGKDDAETPHGSFQVILSTPTADRDGEEVKTAEWEQPLPSRITFDVDHGMSVASTVGSGVPTIDEDGRLVVAGHYASTPLAQTTRALVNEGHITSTSVAFLRRTTPVKGGAPKVTRELLNGAFVAVPANKEALVLNSKALAEQAVELAGKVGARNSATDAQHLQDAHDSLVAAGATCPAPGAGKAAKDATTDAAQGTTAEAPASEEEPSDEDVPTLASALDAAIDEALTAFAALDLPEEGQQALALLMAADQVADRLLDALGVPDPDEDTTAPADETAASTAAAASSQEAAAAALAARLSQSRAAAYRALNAMTEPKEL